MTLMEVVVALMILALVSVGCLELAQGASTQEFSAMQWNAAISAAESRMAEATTAAPQTHDTDNVSGEELADIARRNGTSVTRESWSAQLDLLTVSVPVTGEKRYVLRKLVPARVVRSAAVPDAIVGMAVKAFPNTASPAVAR